MIKFQLRRGTAAEWNSRNPILRSGEPGVELDTRKVKIGDGSTSWISLAYYLNQTDIEDLIDAAILASGGGDADPRVGDMTALTTTVKTSVVGAINEVNTPPVSLTALYTNAKAG